MKFSRKDNLIVQLVSQEALIYKSLHQTAYRLNPIVTKVFLSIQDETGLTDIRKALRNEVSGGDIEFALSELLGQGLIDNKSEEISRRTFVKAAALAVPMISCVSLPQPSGAVSVVAAATCTALTDGCSSAGGACAPGQTVCYEGGNPCRPCPPGASGGICNNGVDCPSGQAIWYQCVTGPCVAPFPVAQGVCGP